MTKNDPYAVEVGANGYGLMYGVARFTHEPSARDLDKARREVRALILRRLAMERAWHTTFETFEAIIRDLSPSVRLERIDADAIDNQPSGAYCAAWMERA